MSEPNLLDDPVAFWDERHAALDPWRSGGDRGISPDENYEFYAYRLGRVIELIRRHAGADRPLRILDAGCGKGHFADALSRCGHDVVGIDTSPTAIAWAQETYGKGRARFHQCALDAHRPEAPFDVVLCIDVLFHVLDDGGWRAALAAFGRYASAESLLILTDAFPASRCVLTDYIVHRTAGDYERALAETDFELAERIPYAFGANAVEFAAYRRRG